MDFHHLKVFLAAARHLNYTRAGEELRLQQPTVSAHIKQLEAELGVTFIRADWQASGIDGGGALD